MNLKNPDVAPLLPASHCSGARLDVPHPQLLPANRPEARPDVLHPQLLLPDHRCPGARR